MKTIIIAGIALLLLGCSTSKNSTQVNDDVYGSNKTITDTQHYQQPSTLPYPLIDAYTAPEINLYVNWTPYYSGWYPYYGFGYTYPYYYNNWYPYYGFYPPYYHYQWNKYQHRWYGRRPPPYNNKIIPPKPRQQPQYQRKQYNNPQPQYHKEQPKPTIRNYSPSFYRQPKSNMEYQRNYTPQRSVEPRQQPIQREYRQPPPQQTSPRQNYSQPQRNTSPQNGKRK
jgi:hypothetical protein